MHVCSLAFGCKFVVFGFVRGFFCFLFSFIYVDVFGGGGGGREGFQEQMCLYDWCARACIGTYGRCLF